MRHPLAGGLGLALGWGLLLVLLLTPAGATGAAVGTHPAGVAPAELTRPGYSAPPPGLFDWATFHGSDNRSGYTPVSGPSGTGEAWAPVGASTLPIRAGPAVNASRIFVADIIGRVVAISRLNGTVLWNASLWANPTTPTLAGGRLYVGCDNGVLYALNASTGRTLWNRSLGSAVIQGTLDIGGELLAATEAGELFALDDGSGAVRWSLPLGGASAGAPAEQNGTVYAATTTGGLRAATLAGSLLWSTNLSQSRLNAGPAVAGSTLFLGATNGNLTALDASNGSVRWSFSSDRYAGGGSIDAPPASDGRSVDWISDGGTVFSLNVSNGSLRWVTNGSVGGSAGYPLLSAPVLTPTGLYLIDGQESLDDFNPETGALRWSYEYGGLTVYSSPAVIAGGLVIGTDDGVVDYFAAASTLASWPVTGLTVDPNGTPLPNITLELNSRLTTSAADGSFTLYAPNGTYTLLAAGPATETTSLPLTITGPIHGLRVVVRPLTLFPVDGRLIDGASARAVGGAFVSIIGSGGYTRSTLTAPDGSFALRAPNGTDYLTVGGLSAYAGFAEHVQVSGVPLLGLVIELSPVGLSTTPYPASTEVTLLLLVLVAGALVAWLAEVSRRRRDRGLSGRLLSRFGRYVLMRASLMPVQLLCLLALLYVFGSFLPQVAEHAISTADTGAMLQNFFLNLFSFAYSMVTVNWGYASYGHLIEPVTTYIQWWLPYTLELMAFALAISAALGYAVGLLAGWRSDGAFDIGSRMASLLGLLLPSFLVILLVLGGTYTYFIHAVGDTPYGILPNLNWYDSHGGSAPGWIGIGGNTLPTGFPLLDSAYHSDWPFFEVVFAKTLFQATLIAIVYVAIFLRYARHAAAEHARALAVVAARSRGVPERRLLWHHTGRRALPEFVLLFAITLPVYIGTQAVAEALFSDPGVGNVLLTEMTQVASSGFGLTHGGGFSAGNLYQVAILFLFLLVLGGNLLADVVARYLDPRLLPEGR
ncbi:MAG: PQQ-binding-like beta-propeller repeat protein [Thermoplasmata archaeon]|nr:PQQ-binding-like beta-propeller repeat protein [Thermoplasmata archaeon]MCI4337738.1 PQQ-binding-like beta-propeller repeat protein [Thermoplasmata archaeon]MCI4340872.1 PQQ-binding-like beta-propeller repeat protein [Thermoplasmata archaeon]